jgi:MFS family permease
MSAAGVAASAWLICSETLLQLGASNQFRGRIFGTLGTTSALASLAGMLLAGSLADLLGLVPILCISGSLYIISGLMAWLMLPRIQSSQPDQPFALEKELSKSQAPVN